MSQSRRPRAPDLAGCERAPVFVQPVLQAEDDQVDAIAVAAEGARRVEQLLEHLIERREFDAHLPSNCSPQNRERILERFGRESGGDAKP